MIASAILFYSFEDQLFSLINYKWKGPSDIYFIALALLELFLGLWVIIIYLPRKIGRNDFRNIFAGNFPNELFGYKIAGIVGFFAGLSFSGIWKIVLIALRSAAF
jgi:hypothetical protein